MAQVLMLARQLGWGRWELGLGFLWLLPRLSSPGRRGGGSPEEESRGKKSKTPEIALYEAVALDSVPDYRRKSIIYPNTKELFPPNDPMSGHILIIAHTN